MLRRRRRSGAVEDRAEVLKIERMLRTFAAKER